MIENWAGGNIWMVIAIKVAIVGMVFLPAISVIAMFSIWWERKVAGHIQSRVGPMHVGGWHGWAQSIADGVKLIFKEDLIPRGADTFLFRLAPYLAFAPVFAGFLALPFGPQFVFEAGLNIGVLYILAVLSVEIMSVIMAGWGSNSKWAVYGAMREACQMVSYEVPLGLSIITGVLVAGTLNMVELGYLQGGGLWDWFVFHNPFIFGSFLVYFIASLASNKRAPFDLPESESELVAGYHTEYSGLRFSFFFFAEYAGMFIVGGIQAALFMGCWNSPLGGADPIYAIFGYDPVAAGTAYFNGTMDAAKTFGDKADAINAATAGGAGTLTGFGLVAINMYSAFWFVAKAMTVIWIQMWLRWTLPRIRIDQVLHTCVKVLLPLSLVGLLGTAMWVALVPQPGPGFVAAAGRAPVPITVKLNESGIVQVPVDPKLLAGDNTKINAAKIGSVDGGTLSRIIDDKPVALKPGEVVTLKELEKGLAFKAAKPAADAKPEEAARVPSFTLVSGTNVTRAGHLVSDARGIQGFTQIVFMLIFLGIAAFCALIMMLGWMGVIFKDPRQPPKTLFPDVMPVGREIAFTKGKAEPKPETKAAE